MELQGRKILLGICGGIAAYKSIELLRLFQKGGARVRVVMTERAKAFVGPLTFQALSGFPVYCSPLDPDESGEITHIELAREADLLVVAPATANMVGKFAGGIADDLLSTLFLARSGPTLIAPAMNSRMYRHQAVQRNIQTLRDWDKIFVDPEEGSLACGEEGEGRLASPETILSAAKAILLPRETLRGQKILITAGPTREFIDPVRFISNPSTGKMGYALASLAAARGAEVTLLSGPVSLPSPPGVKRISVTSAGEMYDAVMKEGDKMDIFIMTAAVGDYRPEERAPEKIKKGEGDWKLSLKRTPDILKEVGRREWGKVRIGFAAETEKVVEHAKAKVGRKNLDFIVANDVSKKGNGFESDFNEIIIVDKKGGEYPFPPLPKEEVAGKILDHLVSVLPPQ